MLNFTAPNGSPVEVDGSKIIRVRQAIYGENKNASTRIDWTSMNLVRESVDEVTTSVKAMLPSFTSLTGGSGVKIWFDAKKVEGPLPVPANRGPFGYKSSIRLLNYRQAVMEDTATVQAILNAARAAGGGGAVA